MNETDNILTHVQSNTLYFVVCSDCENRSNGEINPTLAAKFAHEAGWTTIGSRIICPVCYENYNVGSNSRAMKIDSVLR